ncbi:xanthine dehydrogenase [Aspergillus saccharolyticus JOP 1030-1]|uniref:Xanthine dehydrogenase n=1 Tax=Aspergillus saccharolyticus JOP 1030-1 TaxID=1450539 RepID=A0A318ZJQ1_9EURO|nr:xanthine dehydrogenase [Aspergillus saccharolyticus JOP 1030-1]PYH47035.1 xanthine dehydrogenase [Aspergillus saccharolyticus JOP 1030-1]
MNPNNPLHDYLATEHATSLLTFYLNGTPISLHSPHPQWTLLDFIRAQDGLKGTKLGCGEGGCGACTVVLQFRHHRTRRMVHRAVNACLYPLVGVVGKHVITIEGLGTIDHPHPLQERMAKLHGSQSLGRCGFCTPGIVMSLYALIRNAYDPRTQTFTLSEDDIEMKGHLDGNLCRCTGYKPILQAAKTFLPLLSGSCGRAGGCCRDGSGSPCSDSERASSGRAGSSGSSGSGVEGESSALTTPDEKPIPQFDFIPYLPHTELIYPPALARFVPQLLYYADEQRVWLRPVTIEQTLAILAQCPSATLVGGASEVQVDVRFRNLAVDVSVFIGDIEELAQIHLIEDRGIKQLVIGGNASLTDIEEECQRLAPALGRSGSPLSAMTKVLRYFAGRQIRNAASLAGNIATASPISDMNPLLLAVNATIVTRTLESQQTNPMQTLFLGYRRTALPKASLITEIRIPLAPSTAREFTQSYKQAKRKDDDIAIVTAAFRVRLTPDDMVEEIALAYGGMAPTTVLAPRAAAVLQGNKWGVQAVLDAAVDALLADFDLVFGVPGGMATYRRTLAVSFFVRFWHEVCASFNLAAPGGVPGEVPASIPEDLTSEIHRHISTGARDETNPYEQRVVGKALPHLSGLKHATGEAEYLDDMPPQHRQLFGALVLSQRAHAKLLSVDWTPALAPGLAVGYIDHTSIPEGKNLWGSVVHDEPLFAVNEVHAHGQPIGMVYAETALQAQAAAKAVRVEYADLPVILTIDEAIQAGSFFPHGKELRKGLIGKELEGVFASCYRVFSGTTRVGGQEHFYLETNAAMAVPSAEDEMLEVWSSTQNTMETQDFVSQVTSIPASRINARVKRMGGAFGGKESRSVPLACFVALAAQKTRRPVRAMLARDEDMMTTGQRHPVQCRWRVGVDAAGKLLALSADCYNNAGWSLDMSGAVMDRCCTHLDNCYEIPNVHIRGWVCRTNTHSNTAFRGFGAPQSMFVTESMMYAVAEGLGVDVDELRRRNLYAVGQRTPFLQQIDQDWHVPMLLEQVRVEARYDERRREVERFNATHPWRKRGICLVPSKFGISFATALHLNQAAASVKIYTDGSVLLNHGGTEMGQGLYTKMAQVAAQALGVPLESIFTQDTSSYQTANASPTAASSGSDLNGMAIQDACNQLNARLQPYRERLGVGASMAQLAHAAYRDRVNLTASGFWKMPRIGYEWGTYDVGKVKPMYYYFTQGVACTEVELDLLTGDHTVLRTDIKMDVGRSINPAIDYGQIEGAFVQGQGLFTMEESLWTRSGLLATRGPGNYKIPGFSDIPQVFNVSFLQGVSWEHLRSIQSSKGIGEPPLFLGATVLFALRDALRSAREQNGVQGQLVLDSPATAEKLRLLVGDELVRKSTVVAKEGETNFFVAVA